MEIISNTYEMKMQHKYREVLRQELVFFLNASGPHMNREGILAAECLVRTWRQGKNLAESSLYVTTIDIIISFHEVLYP